MANKYLGYLSAPGKANLDALTGAFDFSSPVAKYVPATVFGAGADFDPTGHGRNGFYLIHEVRAADGTYPTGRFDAYGTRMGSTMVAAHDGGKLFGYSAEPNFDADGYANNDISGVYSGFLAKAGSHFRDAILLFADSPSRETGATFENLYGLYVNLMSGANTINRAIHTAGGDHFFGGPAEFGGSGDGSIVVTHGNIAANDGNISASGVGQFGELWVGNSAAGTTLGAVVKKVQVFSGVGVSLGYVPVYNAIT